MGSEAAKALAALRWKGTTEEERRAHARLMVNARWAKYRKHKEALRKARERRKGQAEE